MIPSEVNTEIITLGDICKIYVPGNLKLQTALFKRAQEYCHP